MHQFRYQDSYAKVPECTCANAGMNARGHERKRSEDEDEDT